MAWLGYYLLKDMKEGSKLTDLSKKTWVLFYTSLSISLILLLISLSSRDPIAVDLSVAVFMTNFFYFEAVSFVLILSLLALKLWQNGSGKKLASRLAFLLPHLTVFFTVFVIGIFLEAKFLGDGFSSSFLGLPVPSPVAPDQDLLGQIHRLLGLSLTTGGAPSDHVFMQWTMTLCGLLFLSIGKTGSGRHHSAAKFGKIASAVFLVFSTMFVSLARLFQQVHNPVDVTIALDLGSLFFWVFVFGFLEIKGERIEEQMSSSLSLFGMFSFVILVFIARNPLQPSTWAAFLILPILTSLVSLVPWFSRRIQTRFRPPRVRRETKGDGLC